MSDAPPPPPAASSQPDPNRAGTGAAEPRRVGRLLGLVRRLIEYGRNLTQTLQRHPSGPRFVDLACAFGTTDLAIIIARVVCGLRRAVLLEARLDRRAATGRDLGAAPVRAPANTANKPRAERPKQPEAPKQDGLPTVEQIAAEVRRRPIGAVIVDICRDFGIMSGDIDVALYDELVDAITRHGGQLARFFRNMNQRLRNVTKTLRTLAPAADPSQVAQSPPSPGLDVPSAAAFAHGTGPP